MESLDLESAELADDVGDVFVGIDSESSARSDQRINGGVTIPDFRSSHEKPIFLLMLSSALKELCAVVIYAELVRGLSLNDYLIT